MRFEFRKPALSLGYSVQKVKKVNFIKVNGKLAFTSVDRVVLEKNELGKVELGKRDRKSEIEKTRPEK